MIQVLFVDDDAVIRHTIQKSIPWETTPFCLCYVARDGLDAIQYTVNHPVDIVLTDIKMPGLDGLEMARQMKTVQPDLLFIFLSGHEDFTYAKEALKLNAFDYLSKPIGNEQLLEALLHARELLETNRRERRVLQVGLPALRRQCLSQAFATGAWNPEEGVPYGLRTHGADAMAGLITFQLTPLVHQKDLALLPLRFCEEMEAEIPFLTVVSQGMGLYRFLYLPKRAPVQLAASLEAAITRHTAVPFTIKVSAPFADLSKLLVAMGLQKEVAEDGLPLCESVCGYLAAHYAESSLTLQSIAEHFGMNHCHLTTVFKKKMGLGLYDYLINLRMEKARELILTTNLKATEIARAVGYEDSQYFSRSFRKRFQVSLSEYRQAPRESESPQASQGP